MPFSESLISPRPVKYDQATGHVLKDNPRPTTNGRPKRPVQQMAAQENGLGLGKNTGVERPRSHGDIPTVSGCTTCGRHNAYTGQDGAGTAGRRRYVQQNRSGRTAGAGGSGSQQVGHRRPSARVTDSDPVQLTNSYVALANCGTLVKARRIGRRCVATTGKVVKQIKPAGDQDTCRSQGGAYYSGPRWPAS